MKKKNIFLIIYIFIILMFFSLNVKAVDNTDIFEKNAILEAVEDEMVTYYDGKHIAVKVRAGEYVRIPLVSNFDITKITDGGNNTELIIRDCCYIFFRKEANNKYYMYVYGRAYTAFGYYNQKFKYNNNEILVETNIQARKDDSYTIKAESVEQTSSPERKVYSKDKKGNESEYLYHLKGDVITNKVNWYKASEGNNAGFCDIKFSIGSQYSLKAPDIFEHHIDFSSSKWRYFQSGNLYFWASSKYEKFLVYTVIKNDLEREEILTGHINGNSGPAPGNKYEYPSHWGELFSINVQPSFGGESELPTFSQYKISTKKNITTTGGSTVYAPIWGWNNITFDGAQAVYGKGQTENIKIGNTIDYVDDSSGIEITSDKNKYEGAEKPNTNEYFTITIPENVKELKKEIKIPYYVTLVNYTKKEKKYYIYLTFNITVKEGEKEIGVANDGGKVIDVKEYNENYEPSEIDIIQEIQMSKGSNGNAVEYKENVSNLLTSINNGDFEIDTNMGTKTQDLISKALSYVMLFGIIICIICIALLGFRTLMGSASEKAEYKEAMITFTVGALILTAGSAIVKLIIVTTQNW